MLCSISGRGGGFWEVGGGVPVEPPPTSLSVSMFPICLVICVYVRLCKHLQACRFILCGDTDRHVASAEARVCVRALRVCERVLLRDI